MNQRYIVVINTVIMGILFFVLIWGLGGKFSKQFDKFFQYKKNLNGNDNSLNWVNHNYGKNLLMGIEPNSIFMTEGGDNQVFSILYFALVEKKRPDVDFFDQKGNVFPRLYGDLLNTYSQELELIQAVRDFQLYSTDRPVYLTWKRKDIEKLNFNYLRKKKKELLKKISPSFKNYIERKYQLQNIESLKRTTRNYIDQSIFNQELRSGGYLYQQDFKYLGPWYLKQFGLAYRVTPIRYSIVDALDIYGGKGNYNSLVKIIKEITKINLNKDQYFLFVEKLEKEGFIRIIDNDLTRDNSIELVNKFDSVFENYTAIDYWNNYKFFYKNVYNSYDWDLLTLEIYSYYARYQRAQYLDWSNFLTKKVNYESDNKKIRNLKKMAAEFNKKANKVVKESITFHPKNIFLNYLMGSILAKENQPLEAIKFYSNINEVDYRNHQSLVNAIRLLFNYSLKNQDENFILNLQKCKKLLNRLLETKLLYYRSRKLSGYEKDKDVVSAHEVLLEIDRLIDNARKTKLISRNSIKKSGDLIAEIKDKNKLKQLLKAFQEKGDFTQVEKIYEKLVIINPEDKKTFNEYVNFLRKYNPDKGVTILLNVITNKDFSPELSESDATFYLAKLYFDKAEDLINSNTKKDLYERSKKLFSRFNTLVENNQKVLTSKVKNRKIISEKSISYIDLILSK